MNRPIQLTQCCIQFKSPGDKILCVLYLHYNVAFTFKWYGNYWNKTFYSQRVWIGYNIELAEQVYHQNGEKVINFFSVPTCIGSVSFWWGTPSVSFTMKNVSLGKKNDALLKYSENIKTLTERKIDTGSLRKGTVSWWFSHVLVRLHYNYTIYGDKGYKMPWRHTKSPSLYFILYSCSVKKGALSLNYPTF